MSTASLPLDVLDGELSLVADIAKRKTGKRPCPATIWRWCRKGLRGGRVRLQAIHHSGQWQTTEDAFRQFLVDQTEDAMAREIKEEPAAADDELRAAGLL